MRVEIHEFTGDYDDSEVDEALSFARGALASQLSAAPSECGDQVDQLYIAACGAQHLMRFEDAHELLVASCEASGAVFKAISARPGSIVSFPLRGSILSGPSGAPSESTGLESWMAALLLVAALRRRDLMQTLADVPSAVLQAAPVETPWCYVELSRALESLCFDDDMQPSLDGFWRFSKPGSFDDSPPDTLARFSGVAMGLAGIAAQDQGVFNEGVRGALAAHREYYGHEDGQNLVTGLIDCLASGIAVLGLERGFTLSIESDYMPSWLVK